MKNASATALPLPLADPPSRGVVGKIWSILTPQERRHLLGLLPAVIVMALFEVAGVASIVPFLALLSDPNAIENSRYLTWAYDVAGFSSRESFFFYVGAGVLTLVTVGNVIAATTTWRLLQFAWLRNDSLSTRLLRAYLDKPYEFFLNSSTADLSKNVLTEVQNAVAGVIVQCVQMLARVAVVLAVSASLVVVDPLMAIGVVCVFGGVYGGLFWFVRQAVSRAGRDRLSANGNRFRFASEALVGIKEVKLYGLIDTVMDVYQVESKRFAVRSANNATLAQIPRFALETIAFGGVLGIVLYLLSSGSSLEEALPMLGLYAFAAYRLLPSLQILFAGVTNVRFHSAALDVICQDLSTLAGENPDIDRSPERESIDSAAAFETALSLRSVHFSYERSDRPVLDNVNLSIAPGEWLALVGETGSGKSTIVDLLLGFLCPSSGEVVLDGSPVTTERERSAWQQNCAYVPQQIFLIDDTVARNICFGVPESEIDEVRMQRAAKTAQIHDFISTELSNGYATTVGERGIRLSGGQRQRIGIARAIYRAPQFLVLDEATSALDSATEGKFFAALRDLHKNTAVISIAHRLSTTRDFDRILLLERGAIAEEGTYASLVVSNPYFAGEAAARKPELGNESITTQPAVAQE